MTETDQRILAAANRLLDPSSDELYWCPDYEDGEPEFCAEEDCQMVAEFARAYLAQLANDRPTSEHEAIAAARRLLCEDQPEGDAKIVAQFVRHYWRTRVDSPSDLAEVNAAINRLQRVAGHYHCQPGFSPLSMNDALREVYGPAPKSFRDDPGLECDWLATKEHEDLRLVAEFHVTQLAEGEQTQAWTDPTPLTLEVLQRKDVLGKADEGFHDGNCRWGPHDCYARFYWNGKLLHCGTPGGYWCKTLGQLRRILSVIEEVNQATPGGE